MLRALHAAAAALLLLLAAPARAEHPTTLDDADSPFEDPWGEEEQGVHEHDGFMFRVSLGAGLGSLQEQRSVPVLDGDSVGAVDQKTDVDGAGLFFALDLGWGLSSSWTVHARLTQLSLPDPTLRSDSSAQRSNADSTRSVAALGPAISYHLMPANVYATASLGVAAVRRPGYDGDTSLGDTGLAANLDIGKEWWADTQWGVGAVARLFWVASSAVDPDGRRRETEGWALATLLSVTYQ